MALFEIPHGVNPDVQKAFTKLLHCCETVHSWGTWHDIPFNAANFTVLTAGGTWTVAAANVKTLKYVVVHNTMTVAFEVIQASVTGPVGGLLITLPLPAFRCITRPVGSPTLIDNGLLFTNACMIRRDLGDHAVGTVSLVNDPTGALVLLIQMKNGENINVVGEGGALGQITFEVQHV
jgi:hypothetical protein